MTEQSKRLFAVPDYSAFDQLTVRQGPWWVQLLVRFQGADLYPICATVVYLMSPKGLWSTVAALVIIGLLALIRASPEFFHHGTNREKRHEGPPQS